MEKGASKPYPSREPVHTQRGLGLVVAAADAVTTVAFVSAAFTAAADFVTSADVTAAVTTAEFVSAACTAADVTVAVVTVAVVATDLMHLLLYWKPRGTRVDCDLEELRLLLLL